MSCSTTDRRLVDPASYKPLERPRSTKPLELPSRTEAPSSQELIVGLSAPQQSRAIEYLWWVTPLGGPAWPALLRTPAQITAREVVSFGADHGTEEMLTAAASPQEYEQNFARRPFAGRRDESGVLLVWEMNRCSFASAAWRAVRLLVPGWYGICNAKW